VTEALHQRVERLEKTVETLKDRMADKDSIMTEEDYEALLAYRKEKAEGKLVPAKRVKDLLGP